MAVVPGFAEQLGARAPQEWHVGPERRQFVEPKRAPWPGGRHVGDRPATAGDRHLPASPDLAEQLAQMRLRLDQTIGDHGILTWS